MSFVLNLGGVLEVVLALDVRIGPDRLHRQTERGVVAGSDLAVLREVVAVRIAPGAGVALELQRVVAGREAGRLAGHVPAEAGLERRAAGAEQVVRHAEARRDVEPARQTSHLVEGALRREAAGADVLILDLTDEPLEADAHVQGHAVDRPGILHEHPEVGVQVLVRADRRVVDADRVGDAVAIELDEVAVDVVLEDVVTEGPVDSRS